MCVFCKIVNGEIPCFKVYEDEQFLGFLDISQATKGHTLVIPKKHISDIFELDNETAQNMLGVVSHISRLLKTKLGVSSVNIINNSGKLAGQTVNHFHIHIIPRYENDNCKIEFMEHEPDFNMLKELQEIINN